MAAPSALWRSPLFCLCLVTLVTVAQTQWDNGTAPVGASPDHEEKSDLTCPGTGTSASFLWHGLTVIEARAADDYAPSTYLHRGTEIVHRPTDEDEGNITGKEQQPTAMPKEIVHRPTDEDEGNITGKEQQPTAMPKEIVHRPTDKDEGNITGKEQQATPMPRIDDSRGKGVNCETDEEGMNITDFSATDSEFINARDRNENLIVNGGPFDGRRNGPPMIEKAVESSSREQEGPSLEKLAESLKGLLHP
ncbi:unnamed protein product [Vitrella brassicaformis CCMP3155]|uniref:Uncharacterized protein n=1 Tax=Vitrella brassicaformis (strain CCMP3155) TaxID=1169540 RepID=A0A0G4GIA2_VITBC|nr:unnamed protein product [Vitrella brassicaformis CCMP3155]|eukprot:CEM29571.1 unnamed protein product [Vitrella brassicaformis CCMP3155]